MAEREVLQFLLVLLMVTSGLADSDLILSPKETNIVANVNEKAVLPCRPTSNHVNMTLYKGEYSWSMKRIYVGKQPYRNQTVTFEPDVGFILDPVTTLDIGTFRCKGIDVRDLYNSSSFAYDRRFRWSDPDLLKFTLDVNTGRLLVTPPNNTIIVKEGSDAVLPCKANNSINTIVKLYKESFHGFEHMIVGTIQDRQEALFYDDDDDDDDDSDHSDEHDDVDSDGNGEDKHSLLYDVKKGFIFSPVKYSDDDTYMCEARKQNQKEVMYFYLHVHETHILRGTEERYITVYEGEDLVLPCKPINGNVTVKLYHTSAREIFEGSRPNCNQTVKFDPNVGFTLMRANMSDAGQYRCDASFRTLTESAYFYVYVNNGQLLEQVNDSSIYPSGSGSMVIPCRGKNRDVKVELYRELAPAIHRLIPRRSTYYGPRAVYDQRKGFTVYYYGHTNSEHLLCQAQLGKKHDSLFFYWHGENLLLHPNSRIIVADTGDKAVLPCRTTDADIDVRLFIGASFYKRREIKMGQQSHRNQTVTFDPEVGVTLFPVSHLDSSWYRCTARSDTLLDALDLYLEVREPPRITHTNLSVNKSLENIVGQNMTMDCKSEGMPYPVTIWFKDDNPLVIDTSYELSDRNQSLIIKMVKLEHEGKYSCLVRNELGEDKAEGHVTIKAGQPTITRTNLNKDKNVMTQLKESLTIFCESLGKPEPKTVWFKDGKPVITDASVELGERNQSLTIKVVDVEHTGLYCCKVSNGYGEVQSQGKVTLAGTEPVSVTDTNLNYTMNLEAKLGESVVIFCKSQGKPEPKTNWFKDGKPVVPDNTTVKLSHRNQELYLIPVKFEHEGRYCCVANNGLTEAHMEGNLTVKEPAKIIETNLNVSHNIAAEAGTDLMMFCKSEGNPLPNITWFKDGKPLDIDSTVELKDNNQTLTIKGMKQEAEGMYRCVVRNELSVVQMSAAVNVKDDSASVIITSIVCVLVLLAIVAALAFYIRRGRQYVQLKKPREDTGHEDHSDFSERLQEEYFRSPRSHGGDNDVGNLIVSECLPETSRPVFDYSDDYSNINSVSKSSEIGNFPSHASAVRSVEMKSV